jgi:spore maturation protein CgeB
MRILVLNADYPRFLAWFYRRQAGLENAAYATQMASRNASLFGVADFYSRNFAALGHESAEIHINNPWLQAAWAREHGIATEVPEPPGAAGRKMPPAWLQRVVTPFKPMLRPLARKVGLSPRLDTSAENILLAQIEEFRPDLVLNQDIFHVDTRLARRIKAIGNPVMVGQVGLLPPRGEDWSVYALLISQLPSVVRSFRALGVRSEVSHLAFEPAILDVLPEAPAPDIDVSFVGTVSADHQQRIALLLAVAERYNLKLWGNLPQGLPATSTLHRSDFKDNLDTLFAPDREVAVWRSTDDCLAAIGRALGDDNGRAAVARAGQARTITQHTYRHRAAEILDLVDAVRAQQ